MTDDDDGHVVVSDQVDQRDEIVPQRAAQKATERLTRDAKRIGQREPDAHRPEVERENAPRTLDQLPPAAGAAAAAGFCAASGFLGSSLVVLAMTGAMASCIALSSG